MKARIALAWHVSHSGCFAILLNHILQLKQHFKTVKKLREVSGFGWDDGAKLVTVSDDVWDIYLKV